MMNTLNLQHKIVTILPQSVKEDTHICAKCDYPLKKKMYIGYIYRCKYCHSYNTFIDQKLEKEINITTGYKTIRNEKAYKYSSFNVIASIYYSFTKEVANKMYDKYKDKSKGNLGKYYIIKL